MTIVKPRKIVWVMRDFINAASDLEYTPYFNGEKCSNGVKVKCTVEFVKGEHFFTILCNPLWRDIEEHFIISYNIDDLHANETKDFRKNFVSRCPMGKGFANITLILLHELGHQETNIGVWSGTDRDTAMVKLAERFKKGEIDEHQMQNEYFGFPDEKLATDWAIEWLKDAEHRKIAKIFEKKFFKCIK